MEFPSTPEEALDNYWLMVWRNLVEMYWDFIERDQEIKEELHRGYCVNYSFMSARMHNIRPKDVIDDEVADLARDYWRRNRSDLKEYFVNYTISRWPNHAIYDILQAANGSSWIDCGVDPVYPNRRSLHMPIDAEQLDKIGWIKEAIEEAICKVNAQYSRHIFDASIEKYSKQYDRHSKAKRKLMAIKITKAKDCIVSCIAKAAKSIGLDFPKI